MKRACGILLIAFAAFGGLFGAYLGLWVFLVGGIGTFIEQLQADHIDATVMAWAIVRIVFFEVPFGIGAALAMVAGGYGGKMAFDN